MCTHPITITRNIPLVGIKSYTVPCGKCAECVNKKRSELAALSVHQANVSGDVRFFTLTYRNETCPIAIYDPKVDAVVGYERDCKHWIVHDVFCNRTHVDKKRDLLYTPSLRREDVKLWLKQFRTTWKRVYGDTPKFKYLIFGEYGERHGRPHYHGLFYGLTPAMCDMLKNLWQDRYGFTACVPSPDRSLSVDDIAAISQYVSKYISKGIHSRFADILPFVERPRRQSSIDFGQFSDAEIRQYANFIMDAISYEMGPDILQLKNYLASLLVVNLSKSTAVVSLCPRN